MSKKKIRIGIIGGGFMGKAHSNAYRTIPYMYHKDNYDIEMVSLGAATLEEAEEAAVRYGWQKVYEGYEAIVNDPAIDLIDICASDALHKPIALAALENGKHVLCEKPLALNASDAEKMRDAAVKAGSIAMCGYNYRFVGAVMLAKQLVDSGLMGRVYHFHGEYLQDLGAWEETELEKLFYAYGAKGSGTALAIGTHLIDMARFLVGEMTHVSGLFPTYNSIRNSKKGPVQVTVDEEMLVTAQFDGGATALLRASEVAAGRKNCLRWELSCSKGSIAFDLENLNYLDVFLKESPVTEVVGFTRINVTQMDRNHPFADIWWPRGHMIGWEHAHINEIAHMLRSISGANELYPGASFEDGYRVARIIDTAKISAGNLQQIKY
jgi:predicted dehydrogenase